MKGRELRNLGLRGAQIKKAQMLCREAAEAGLQKKQMRAAVRAIVADPQAHLEAAAR